MEAIGDKLEFFSAKNDFPFIDFLHCTVPTGWLPVVFSCFGLFDGVLLFNLFLRGRCQ